MAEKITIQGKEVSLSNGSHRSHSISVSRFSRCVSRSTLSGLEETPRPRAEWCIESDKFTLCIVELTPEFRCIRWLAEDSPTPFGPESLYRERRLATPYVVLKVPFLRSRLLPRIEVFYRTEPLRRWDGEGGELFFPNLYNVSVNAYGCTSWYCSQYLEQPRGSGVQASLERVVHHLFGGGFNASSEFHEGESTFGLCLRENVDSRVTDVDRWEAESVKDPRFVLQVKWKSTGLTVKDVIDRELAFNNIQATPETAESLGNILLREAAQQ